MQLSPEQTQTILDRIDSAGLLSDDTRLALESLIRDSGENSVDVRAVAEAARLTEFQIRRAAEGSLLKVGPYALLECIGHGGMGVVFRARHEVMRREVAVKVLQFAATDSTVLEGHASQAHRRFQREIESLSALKHPGIVQAHDAGRDGNVTYLAMELVDGTNLAQRVRSDGPLEWQTACDLVANLLDTLQFAHNQGFVHRDVKPSNVMLTDRGIKLLDLGLASTIAGSVGEATLTETGSVLGTPDFLAPEQAIDSTTAGPTADQYGAGASLYFLLTGEPPFPGRTAAEKLLKHQTEPPPRPSRLEPDIPRPVDDVVIRLLSKNPEQRFASAAEAAEAIRRCASQDAEPPPSNGIRSKLLLLICAVLIGCSVWTGTRKSVEEDPTTDPSDAVASPGPERSEAKPAKEAPDSEASVSRIAKAENAQLTDAVFLRDGAVLAIAWNDLVNGELPGSIVLWDTEQQQMIRELPADGPIGSLATSPDGNKLLASGGHVNRESDGTVYVVELSGSLEDWTAARFEGHEQGTSRALWLNSTEFLSFRSRRSNTSEPLILKHDLSSPRPIEDYRPSDHSCSAARLVGEHLVVGEYPGRLVVLEPATMKQVFAAPVAYSVIFDIEPIDSSTTLVTCGEQNGNRGAIYSLTRTDAGFDFKSLRQFDATPTDVFLDSDMVGWCTGTGGRLRTKSVVDASESSNWDIGRWIWFEKKHPSRELFFIGSDDGELFLADSLENVWSGGRLGESR